MDSQQQGPNADIVKRARQVLLDWISAFPNTRNERENTNSTDFIDSSGACVHIAELEKDDGPAEIAMTATWHDFDRSQPYESDRIYRYEQDYLIRADLTFVARAARIVDRYPDGHVPATHGPRSANIANLDGVKFLLLPGTPRAASRYREPQVVYGAPLQETLQVLDRLQPADKIQYLLTGPAGLTIRYVDRPESMLDLLDEMLSHLEPTTDPIKLSRAGYAPDAARRSSWNSTFSNFAERQARNRGFDIDGLRQWWAHIGPTSFAPDSPIVADSYVASARLAYAGSDRGPGEHTLSEGLSAASIRPGFEVPNRFLVKHCVSLWLTSKRVDVLAVQPASETEGPAIFVGVGDALIRINDIGTPDAAARLCWVNANDQGAVSLRVGAVPVQNRYDMGMQIEEAIQSDPCAGFDPAEVLRAFEQQTDIELVRDVERRLHHLAEPDRAYSIGL